MMRISVDFPQPDGPTSVRNSPSRIERSIPSRTLVSPNAFEMPLSSTDAIASGRPARRINFVDHVVDEERSQSFDLEACDREAVRSKSVAHSAQSLLSWHGRLQLGTDDKAGRRSPNMPGSIYVTVVGLVNMTARNERYLVACRELQEASPRSRLDAPISRVALRRVVQEQGRVHEPGYTTPVRLGEHLLEPRELPLLLRLAAPEKQRVEPDEAPVFDVMDPIIRTEMAAPPCDALPIHRLK